MTTINTIEDLVRILDERPEWNEALRARMLSRELLDLPQAFAEFAKNAERRLAVLETTLADFMASATPARCPGRRAGPAGRRADEN